MLGFLTHGAVRSNIGGETFESLKAGRLFFERRVPHRASDLS